VPAEGRVTRPVERCASGDALDVEARPRLVRGRVRVGVGVRVRVRVRVRVTLTLTL